jgi:hypothetical protein
MIFVDPRTGLTYEAKVAQISADPCSLCDLQTNCDQRMCRDWRELAVLSLTCIPKTYFKEIGQCKQYK